MLILSRRICNAIYRNSEKVHVFCSALPLQQALADVGMLNRSRVTAHFVKTVAYTRPKKKIRKENFQNNDEKLFLGA